MPRKKLPQGEKLKLLRVYIQEKHFDTFGDDELRAVAHKSVVEYVEHGQGNNNVLK